MIRRNWRRPLICTVLAGGALLAGPCGVTTLQWKDFLTSTLIRTGVSTVSSVLEAATIDEAIEERSGD